jgi:radical SAM superfamily enzyme YgiQ (UPF0313 family)
MKVLLLAGLGPYFKQASDLKGTLFDPKTAGLLAEAGTVDIPPGFRLQNLMFTGPDGLPHRLLRSERSGSLSLTIGSNAQIERSPIPSLSASTLSSILMNADVDYEYLPLDAIWDGNCEPSSDSFSCILLSTTFICDRVSLKRAIDWIDTRFRGIPIVIGGQFSNLKYEQVLRDHPQVFAIVRGDGERALPLLLEAMAGKRELSDVPNLVLRQASGSGTVSTSYQYVDIESYPAPTFSGIAPIVPYESMRGCPFRCKFCSFPAASPQWRYKSAQKIVADWTRYRDVNETKHIRALDSTFTVPRSRFRELLGLLPAVGLGWEAFTRANLISSESEVEALALANCRTLSIGFESMSDNSLNYMSKDVTAKQNRTAFNLLRNSHVGYRVSFMVGYPGETPADYQATHDFLTNEYAGHFQLYVFSLQDETMPVCEDAERFAITLADREDTNYAWTHVGMDIEKACSLRLQTLRNVRWKNNDAIPFLWQTDFQTPLLPHLPPHDNYRAEKLVEQIGFLPVDYPHPETSGAILRKLLVQMGELGISLPPHAAASAMRA